MTIINLTEKEYKELKRLYIDGNAVNCDANFF